MNKNRKQRGQGLVELALILPVLLLIIFGILDFGRILFVYVNLFNAAREGSRYGLVNPRDRLGINQKVRESVALVPMNDVQINVWYDRGPNTATFTDPAFVVVGDRVVVDVSYRLTPITPLIQPIAPEFPVRTSASRTIQSLGAGGAGGGGGGIPAPTFTPTPVVTPSPTVTVTPGPSPTPTTPPSPTPTSTPMSLNINEPLRAGDTMVSGTGQPGQAVTLRVVQANVVRSGWVGLGGVFEFPNLPPLMAGYTVIVSGYGQQDMAIVIGVTPTPTTTPTPTPTPSNAFIVLNSVCYGSGNQQILVKGYNFPTSGNIKRFGLLYDGTRLQSIAEAVNFTMYFTVNVTLNMTHTITVRTEDNGNNPTGDASASASFYSPCPATATPTLTPTPTPLAKPDLQALGLQLQTMPPLGTHQQLKLSMGVANSGTIDVSSLFWVDLYADPAPGVPITQQASIDYVAVNGLPGGGAMTFTMYLPEGFSQPGPHTLVALVDTWDQVIEVTEANNRTAPLSVTLTITNPEPTPTPTPALPPGNPGGIQGLTYVGAFLQSNVSVYVNDAEGRLRWSGRSDQDGNYIVTGLPAGSYTVVAQMRIGNKVYYGMLPVTVSEGVITAGADLILQDSGGAVQ